MNPKAAWKPAASGNYQTGRSQRISRITFHHIVGDAPAAIARFQTVGVQVSATYVIGSDGTLYQCVKEADTPYTDGNYDSNSKAITIEHAGGIASVPYTDAMYATSASLVRDLIARYGITDFQRHRDVIDKSVYPGGTACPGTLDVERIINQAKGGTMADKIDVNLSRVISHGILGRNGLKGRAYSLDGAAGDPWIGADLTAKFLMDIFNSPEAKQWRDSHDDNSVNGINAQLTELVSLRVRVKELEAQLAAGGTGGEFEKVTDLYVKKG